MKIRIKGKGLPKAQNGLIRMGSNMADQDMNALFGYDNPIQPQVPMSGPDQARVAGIAPNFPQDDYTQQYNTDPRYQRKYDRNLFNYHFWNSQNPDSEDYIAAYNKKYPGNFPNIVNKASKIGVGIGAGAIAANAIMNPFIQNKRQKDYNKWLRQSMLPDNYLTPTSASLSGNRGDYDINNGMFRPDELGFKSKGMYTNQFTGPTNFAYGGENTQSMKVRITKAPVQSMKYGGQADNGYGLDTGSRYLYTDMPEDKVDTLAGSLQPVEREHANIEAEHGETVYGDLDGDGGLEHMKVGGKRHSEGGTPLNIPEGSFVFSDTKKAAIKDPEILEMFGLNPKKSGYTPAEIAKRYNINKHKALLEDPNTDQLSKDTAKMMIDNYNKKLGLLAAVQESKKGFPQGIPQVTESALGLSEMAYGGYVPLPKAQKGKEQRVSVWNDDFKTRLDEYIKQKYNVEIPMNARDANDASRFTLPTMQHSRSGKRVYGDEAWTDQEHMADFAKRQKGFMAQNPNWDPTQKGATLKFQQWYNKRAAELGLPSYFGLDGRHTAFDDKFGEYTFSAPDLEPGKPQPPAPPVQEPAKPAEPEVERPMPNGVGTIAKDQTPWGYLTPDLVNMAAAAINPPKKYFPFIADTPFDPGNVTFEDWRGKAAARQSMTNQMTNTMANFQPGNSLGANFSYLAGVQGEGLANDIAGVDARNVQVANMFDSQERQRKDINNASRAFNATERYKGNVLTNQNYDNAMREYVKNMATTFGQAWGNRMYHGLVNSVNPMFNISPRSGKSYFKKGSGYGVDRLSGSQAGGSDGVDWGAVNKGYLNAKRLAPSLTFDKYLSMTNQKGGALATDRDMDGMADAVRGMMPWFQAYSGMMPGSR